MNQELVYEGNVIRLTGEMLSLTDMWKAAGSPVNKDPAQWLRSAAAQAFVEAVSINMGISHNEIVKTRRGGKTPGTFAHWQVALAYAKYLSPEFHMWCNFFMRDRILPDVRPHWGMTPFQYATALIPLRFIRY